MDINKRLGSKVARCRKSKHMTQQELASKCGLATGTIQQYELGTRKISIENLEKIADVLEVPLSFLTLAIDNKKTTLKKQDSKMQDIEKALLEEYVSSSQKQDSEIQNIEKALLEEYISSLRLERLSRLYSALNDFGKDKAIEQVELLSKIPEYQSGNTNEPNNK